MARFTPRTGTTRDIAERTPARFSTPGLRSIRWLAGLVVGLSLASPVLAADGIHWTITGQTSVTFDWRGPENTIEYGLTTAYGQSIVASTPDPVPFSSPGPYWEARLTGLAENTVYHYRIGSGPDHTFRTPPPRGASGFTVFVQGDVGDAGFYWRMGEVQSLIAEGEPDFVLVTGDLTYGNIHGMAAVDDHFNDVMPWSRDAAYMPIWGNHDWEPDDHLSNYTGRFDFPNPQASPGSPTNDGEDWYWFDYGNVRFIAYPENWSGARLDWASKAAFLMDEAQADPAISYIVTFGHGPAYSSGNHAGSQTLAGYMDALGAGHDKYVLNLNSHSHNYERSHPQSGVVHITTGIGGAHLQQQGGACLYEGGCPPPAWSAFRAMHHGAVKLRFTATGIAITAVCGPPGDSNNNRNDITCSPGDAMDSFVIDDPAPPPSGAPIVSAPASVSGYHGAPIRVDVTAGDPDDEPITSLTADLSALPNGHTASFTTGAGNTSGLLLWTPTASEAGGPYPVTFNASNELTGAAATSITVHATPAPPVANLVGNPSFETSTDGWQEVGEKVKLRLVAGGHDGGSALEVESDKDKPFGIHDEDNWVDTVVGSGETYRFSAWARSADHSGRAAIEVSEFLDNVQMGGTTASPIVVLSPNWQELMLDYVTRARGSTLDFRIRYLTTGRREAFEIDDVSIVLLSGGTPNQAPLAHLVLSPATGPAPLMVLADASGSIDPDGTIATYAFDFGDGTTSGPQSGAGATHLFGAGNWTVNLTVTDDEGATHITSAAVNVFEGGGETLGPNLVDNPSFEQSTSGWLGYGGAAITRVSGGVDGNYALEMSTSSTIEYGINDSPTVLAVADGAGTHYRFGAWVRSLTSTDVAMLRVREYDNGAEVAIAFSIPVTLSTTWQWITLDHTSLVTGSFIDLQVLSAPSGGTQRYQVDDVSIRTVTGQTVLAAPNAQRSKLTAFVVPNPTRGGFTLSFVLPEAGPTKVGVYDTLGRRLYTSHGTFAAGTHDLSIGRQATAWSPGIYFYRVEAVASVASGRFVVLD